MLTVFILYGNIPYITLTYKYGFVRICTYNMKMEREIMELFVLELGNRQAKLISEKKEEVLPAYFIEAENFGDRNAMNFAKTSEDVNDYKSLQDGIDYVWGTALDVEYTEFVTDTLAFGIERYQSVEYKLLVDFALARLARDYDESKKGILDVNVVTGVPTKDHTNNEILDAVAAVFKGDHKVEVDGEKLNIRVHDVFILPQSLGTVINEVTTNEGTVLDSPVLETSIAVVDGGGGTLLIDILNKMNVDTKKRKQSNHGAYMLYEDAISRVAEKYGHALSEYEIEKIIREGTPKGKYTLSLAGRESVDLTEKIMEARKSYTRKIINEVKAALKTTERIGTIFVTGGTANLFIKEDFMKAFPNAKFVENSELANARGFYKFAQAEGLI